MCQGWALVRILVLLIFLQTTSQAQAHSVIPAACYDMIVVFTEVSPVFNAILAFVSQLLQRQVTDPLTGIVCHVCEDGAVISSLREELRVCRVRHPCVVVCILLLENLYALFRCRQRLRQLHLYNASLLQLRYGFPCVFRADT